MKLFRSALIRRIRANHSKFVIAMRYPRPSQDKRGLTAPYSNLEIMPILPPLSTLLKTEQERHHKEVSRLTRFHKFISDFEVAGEIGGVAYRLSALGDGAARFTPVDREIYSDYFYDSDQTHEIPDLSQTGLISS